MREWQSQAQVRWYCRYHVVIVPKYRRKSMFAVIRRDKTLCQRFGVELVEGHVMPDHVHMCLGIPPKYSVANTIGKLKGKSAILIHQVLCQHSGVRRRDYEGMIREYIRTQEDREKKEEQLQLGY